MPTPPHRELTPLDPKRRDIADMKLANPRATQAELAEAAGCSTRTVIRALQRPEVVIYMSQYLDSAGATLAKSAQVIAEAHDAKETKFFTHEGKVKDERTVVDHVTRLKAARLAGEFRGEFNKGRTAEGDWAKDLSDEQLAGVASGDIDPASLMQTGDSRMRNPLSAADDD